MLYVTGHITDADEVQDDLETFLNRPVELLPAIENTSAQVDATSEIACERLRLCQLLAEQHDFDDVLVTSITALLQPVPTVKFITSQQIHLAADTTPEGGQAALIEWLIDEGFTRCDQIDVVGDYAQRGGIIDIFSPGEALPLRIEFFGDVIESLRTFDLDTQRSNNHIKEITLNGCRNAGEMSGPDETTIFLNYLPADTIIVLEETLEIAEVGKIFLQRVDDVKGFYSLPSVFKKFNDFDMLTIYRFSGSGPENSLYSGVSFSGQSLQRFDQQAIRGLELLIEEATVKTVYLFCENRSQQTRTQEMMHDITNGKAPKTIHLPIGFIHLGFEIAGSGMIVYGHHELFGQHQRRRRFRKIKSAQVIDNFTDLETNDYIVHINHGIGQFKGLKTIEKHGRREEYLTLAFAKGVLVHVPASKIDLVHKYVGAGGKIALTTLGGKGWLRQKEKVTDAVEEMASELLVLQAHRNVAKGIRFPEDTLWQNDFEAQFPYQETPDQLKGVIEIKKDMCHTRPMDRLLCGDVGYGKTELAMRAAFKAVEHGKQVAVLVPTTVLAMQHFRSFKSRFADFPMVIEVLSRFITAGNATKTLAQVAKGDVDILIGTHRILSKDVLFKDLGLVIIDEEQRFGVTHKERFKQMRSIVDVLTLSATPIPRTLHFALLGIRDISSLMTPPLDRRSIVTEVCNYDRGRIKQILQRELAREGQTFFLHNRVSDIYTVAKKVQSLVPDARVIVGHGKMSRKSLEDTMLKFINHEADILVSTTIIESGIDIPRANTIIINDADRFGLSQLHQLRGRVGRYKNRAYAYMLLPKKRVVNETAIKRLKAIEEYSQLGSGFRIAMRDLEIRGAGNILGAAQSGHIDSVGYELYCRLLTAAVARKSLEGASTQGALCDDLSSEDMMKRAYPATAICHLEVGVSIHIPRDYIPSDRQRMEIYRRLAVCATLEDVEQLALDIKDLFGKLPSSVSDLLDLAQIRLLALKWSITHIVATKPKLAFTFDDGRKMNAFFTNSQREVRFVGCKATMTLTEAYFEPTATLLAVLRRQLSMTP
jgi:transcription-repair coupling factor (superfamily II helicase)